MVKVEPSKKREGHVMTKADVLTTINTRQDVASQFDAAMQGFAELVAAGRFTDADEVVGHTFARWSEVRAGWSEWAEQYIEAL